MRLSANQEHRVVNTAHQYLILGGESNRFTVFPLFYTFLFQHIMIVHTESKLENNSHSIWYNKTIPKQRTLGKNNRRISTATWDGNTSSKTQKTVQTRKKKLGEKYKTGYSFQVFPCVLLYVSPLMTNL